CRAGARQRRLASGYVAGATGIHLVSTRVNVPACSRKLVKSLVGAAGFEPTTSCTQNRRADQAAPRPDGGRNLVAPARPRNPGGMAKARCRKFAAAPCHPPVC